MERASLRPVPAQPPVPTAPAEAVRYVTRELPGLDEAAAAALALVTLVGRPRPEVGGSSDSSGARGLSGEALAEALTRARKALRRKLYPLPGSGWCERAERLISDRLDEALEHPGPARLEVHLANCGRCVEHERRLGQAEDALLAGFAKSRPEKEPERERPPAPAELEAPPLLPVLRAVETAALPGPSPGPDALPSPPPSPAALPSTTSVPPALAAPTVPSSPLPTRSPWTSSIGPLVAVLAAAAVAFVLVRLRALRG